MAAPAVSRRSCQVYATATAVKTLKIGTRGSPLALAQAYLTRDTLKVGSACREGHFQLDPGGSMGHV